MQEYCYLKRKRPSFLRLYAKTDKDLAQTQSAPGTEAQMIPVAFELAEAEVQVSTPGEAFPSQYRAGFRDFQGEHDRLAALEGRSRFCRPHR